jgi:hypothetical protein
VSIELETPGGQGEHLPSRSELRLQAQALRERWPIDPSVRAGMLRVAISMFDPENPTSAQIDDRTKVAAMKVVLAADRLNLQEQHLELDRQKAGEGVEHLVDGDVIDAAAKIVAARKARKESS